MIKVHFHAAAKINSAQHCFGYGRLYHSLFNFTPRVAEIQFVDDYKKADLQVCLITPELNIKYFHWWGRKQHPVQIIYAPWEAEAVSLDWMRVMFEYSNAKAMFATSRWCYHAFEKALAEYGRTLPLYLVQHGVNVNAFPYMERDWSGDLVYLWQGQNLMDRKRAHLVREAFSELDLPNTYLIEKWYPIDTKEWGPVQYPEQRRIEVGRFLTGAEYLEMLQMAHVSINPSRAEGFGMLPIETACTGMATAATNWSGFTDYLNSECFWPLDYELSEVGEDFFNTSMFNPDFKVPPCRDALVSKAEVQRFMRWCYDNREAAKAMGQRAHEYIKRDWTWERAALQFADAIYDVLEQQPLRKSWRANMWDRFVSFFKRKGKHV